MEFRKSLLPIAAAFGLVVGAVEAFATVYTATAAICPSGETVNATYDDSTNTLTVTVTYANGSTDTATGGTTTGGSPNKQSGTTSKGDKWVVSADGHWYGSPTWVIKCIGKNDRFAMLASDDGLSLASPFVSSGSGTQTLQIEVREDVAYQQTVTTALTSATYVISGPSGVLGTLQPNTSSVSTPVAVPGYPGYVKSTVTLTFAMSLAPDLALRAETEFFAGVAVSEDEGYVFRFSGTIPSAP